MSIFTIQTPIGNGWGSVVASYSDIEAAGAIHSLRAFVGATNGVQPIEFLNKADDGRLLQSASSFDSQGEAFNPTEGGSAASAVFANPSLSRLLMSGSAGSVLDAVSQMAFWNPVGSVQHSNHLLKKRVTLGYRGIWNAIEHRLSFILPQNESHGLAQFEVLTGYMPAEFSVFETINPATGVLSPVGDGPGEQGMPLVFSRPDRSAAMGVWVPAGLPGGGYGRWRNPAGAMDCQKWNAVSRVTNPTPGASYDFRVLTAIGSREDVRQTLSGLYGLGEH